MKSCTFQFQSIKNKGEWTLSFKFKILLPKCFGAPDMFCNKTVRQKLTQITKGHMNCTHECVNMFLHVCDMTVWSEEGSGRAMLIRVFFFFFL